MARKKIKLLLASSVFGDRGAEKLILNLYTFLPKDIYEIKILCLRDLSSFADHLNENTDIKVDVLGMKNNFDFTAIFRLYSYIKSYNPDIINFHHYRAALWGRPVAKLLKAPVVLYSVHNKWGNPLHHFLDRVVSRFTDAIVPFSASVMDYLLNVEKINVKYIEQPIYAGIDFERFSSLKEDDINSLKKELGIDDGQMVIGYVGNITVEKGLHYLIEAVKNLSESFTDICCLIIGEGPDEDLLKKKVSDMGLSAHLRFLGQRHDIHNLFRLMSLFVLPSLREGLPLVIAEAMASSCPVVATDVDGIPEIVTHKKNGWLVPPKNVDDLTNAISTLLKCPSLQAEFAAEGLKTARDKFSTDKMIENYHNLYQSYLSKKT